MCHLNHAILASAYRKPEAWDYITTRLGCISIKVFGFKIKTIMAKKASCSVTFIIAPFSHMVGSEKYNIVLRPTKQELMSAVLRAACSLHSPLATTSIASTVRLYYKA